MLTKELDAYYHVYIHRFQKLETELQTNQLSSEEIISFFKNEKTKLGMHGSNLALYSSQLMQTLEQLKSEPSLKDLFVHFIHFIQSKNVSWFLFW